MKAVLFFVLLASPLLAQTSASDRLDSQSLGVGAGSQGLLITSMFTGQHYGIFMGGSHSLNDNSSASVAAQGTGAPSWTQSKGATSEFHIGMAYRLDSRWVLGLGGGFSVQGYDYTLNPGSPTYFGPASNQPGPSSETKHGLVGMADVRIGESWGLEFLVGPTIAGVSLTCRF